MSDDDKNKVPESWDEVFKHPRFKKLVDDKKTAETALADLKTTHQSEIDGLKQQLADVQAGGSDELTTLQKQIDALTSDFETAETARKQAEAKALRMQVANELNIPDWADDLRGEDEAALKAHGEMLLQRINERVQSSTPGVPPRGGGNPPQPITAAQLSDPKFVRENKSKIMSGELQVQ